MVDDVDVTVKARMLADEAATRAAIIEQIGPEMYAKLVGWVVSDVAGQPQSPFSHNAKCRVEYARTEHYQVTATTLHDLADFLRHMFIGEHLSLETELVEPVTIYVDYHEHLTR